MAPTAFYVAVRNSLRPLGLAFNVGMRLPAHLAGSGKAMLAWLPGATLRALLPEGSLARMTDHGARTTDQLDAELARSASAATASTTGACARACCRSARRCSTPPGAVVAGIGMCINKAQLARDIAAARAIATPRARRGAGADRADRRQARRSRRRGTARVSDAHSRDPGPDARNSRALSRSRTWT